jgi:hypothetical protein
MRQGLGPILITFFLLTCGANLWSGANDYELTPRHLTPPKVLLKTCHRLESLSVDFDGNADPYHAQLWRCGPSNPNLKKGRFPINYVVIQPPRDKAGQSAITFSNSGSSDEYFLERPQIINVGPGGHEALLVSGRYYAADQDKSSCLLQPIGGVFECLPAEQTARFVGQTSHIQKSLFRKLDEFLSGQNLPQ